MNFLRFFSRGKRGGSQTAPAGNGATTTAAPKGAAQALDIPSEKIAQRAYEKWVTKGRPMGTSQQDWQEAEAELRAEYAREAKGR